MCAPVYVGLLHEIYPRTYTSELYEDTDKETVSTYKSPQDPDAIPPDHEPCKIERAPVAASTNSSYVAGGSGSSDAPKIGPRNPDKDALLNFISTVMPFNCYMYIHIEPKDSCGDISNLYLLNMSLGKMSNIVAFFSLLETHADEMTALEVSI
ncbi:hypothetical protein Tco_0232464 [Tanacetum coccineum]